MGNQEETSKTQQGTLCANISFLVWGCERRNHVTKESVRSVRSQKGAYRTGRFPYKWFGGRPRDETRIIYDSCDQSIPAGVRMSVIVTVDNATDDLSQCADCKHCGVVCKRPGDLMCERQM